MLFYDTVTATAKTLSDPSTAIHLTLDVLGMIPALHYLFMWILKRPALSNVAKVLVPVAIAAALAYPIIWLNQMVAEAIFG